MRTRQDRTPTLLFGSYACKRPWQHGMYLCTPIWRNCVQGLLRAQYSHCCCALLISALWHPHKYVCYCSMLSKSRLQISQISHMLYVCARYASWPHLVLVGSFPKILNQREMILTNLCRQCTMRIDKTIFTLGGSYFGFTSFRPICNVN